MIGLGFVFPARNPIVARGIKNKQPVPRRRKEKRKKKKRHCKIPPRFSGRNSFRFRETFLTVSSFSEIWQQPASLRQADARQT